VREKQRVVLFLAMDAFSNPQAPETAAVTRAIGLLQSLRKEYKELLCSIQISTWIGLASTAHNGLKNGKIKLTVVTFALHAAIGYDGANEPDETRLSLAKQCARSIPDSLWNVLCNSATHAHPSIPQDPLSLISFTCIRLVLKLLSSDKPLIMTELLHRVKKHSLYRVMTDYVMGCRENIHIPHTGYGSYQLDLHGPLTLAIFKDLVMRKPYNVYAKDFRNHLGLFSILKLDTFPSTFLGQVMANESQRRRTEQTHAGEFVDMSDSFATGNMAQDEDEEEEEEEEEEDEEKEEDEDEDEDEDEAKAEAAEEIGSTMFPQGLNSQQLEDARLIKTLSDLFTTDAALCKLLAIIQSRFAKRASAVHVRGDPSTWATYEFFYDTLLLKQDYTTLVLPASKKMAPYWTGIYKLHKLNTTNRLLMDVLQTALTLMSGGSKKNRQAAVQVFQTKWKAAHANPDKDVTDWSKYNDWNQADVAGIGIFL
jgi:hypothetical protein